MKIYRISTLVILITSALFISSCGEDVTPIDQGEYTFGTNIAKFKNANIYKFTENTLSDFGGTQIMTSSYAISDGVNNSTDPNDYWDWSNYTNGTFLITVQLNAPATSGITVGNYPAQLPGTTTSKWCSIEVTFSDTPNMRWQANYSTTGSLTVSGSLVTGEEIELELEGQLMQWLKTNGIWSENQMEEVSMNFKGKPKSIQ